MKYGKLLSQGTLCLCLTLSACGHAPPPSAAIEKTPPAPETNSTVAVAAPKDLPPVVVAPSQVPAPARPTFPFSGFNGVGTRLDDKFTVKLDDNFGLVYKEGNFTGMPPFDSLVVQVNPKHIICSIELTVSDPHGNIGWAELEELLTRKYGKGDYMSIKDQHILNVRFGSDRRRVELTKYTDLDHMLVLTYSDAYLVKFESDRLKEEHLSQVQKKLGGL